MSKKSDLDGIDFYLVTDSNLSRRGTLSDVEQAVAAGCRIVQYREKDKNTKDMVGEARRIKELCAGRAVFLVNDRVDVALAVDADGVHIGQEDMPFNEARRLLGDRIIGLTVHDVGESVRAGEKGADYIGLSPIFETATKKDAGAGCGTGMVKAVREAVGLPIVAIGGISMENAGEVIRSGADSAVAISAVVSAENVYEAVSEFIRIIRGSKREAAI